MESHSGDLPSANPPGPVDLPGKRRWRRNRVACDSCHTRRVRCDRAFPCARCLRSDIHCEFTRERRKRGRIARSKLETGWTEGTGSTLNNYATGKGSNGDREATSQPAMSPLQQSSPESVFHRRSPTTNDVSLSAPSVDEPQRSGPEGTAMEEWLSAARLSPESYGILGSLNGTKDSMPRLADIWNPVDLASHPPRPPQIPSSISTQKLPDQGQALAAPPGLKYPVLEPVMPFLESNLPRRLVCELLELYFTSAFSTHMHPVCHHIHCYVLRKASFLSTDSPRPSTPALLASMLWVAAVDDRAFSLSISPLQRRKICQFLCALTIRLLRPLIHVSFKDQELAENAGGPQDLAAAAVHHPFEGVADDKGLVGPVGSLDDVITYIHVASIISSSEQKAASMRWLVDDPLGLPVFTAHTTPGGTRHSPWAASSN